MATRRTSKQLTETITFHWPFNPKIERAHDFVLAGFFFSQSVSIFVILQNYDRLTALIFTLLPILSYLKASVFDALRYSVPIPDHHSRGLSKLAKLRLGVGQCSKALSVIRHDYVIISRQDWWSKYEDGTVIFPHELAHLQNRDSQHFHFVAICGLAMAGQLALIVLIAITGAIYDVREVGAQQNYRDLASIFSVSFLIFMLFVFWVRNSLHRKEYNADAFAYATSREHYMAWLKRLERRTRIKHISTYGRARAYFSSLLRSITHPAPQDRINALNSNARKPQRPPYLFSNPWSLLLFVSISAFCITILLLLSELQSTQTEKLILQASLGTSVLCITATPVMFFMLVIEDRGLQTLPRSFLALSLALISGCGLLFALMHSFGERSTSFYFINFLPTLVMCFLGALLSLIFAILLKSLIPSLKYSVTACALGGAISFTLSFLAASNFAKSLGISG